MASRSGIDARKGGRGGWVPAFAGMTVAGVREGQGTWGEIPAYAGMTIEEAGGQGGRGGGIPAYAGMTVAGARAGG